MPLRETWTDSAKTTHAMMPFCDTHQCMNLASHACVDFVETEAPHWWLLLGYPKYELMDVQDTKYGCVEHLVVQQLRMLDDRIVPVPAEFPKSRFRWLITDGLWAVVAAVILAVLVPIVFEELKQLVGRFSH